MYLSLYDQNHLANMVFKPLQKLPYRFGSTERIWSAIESLKQLEDRAIFISAVDMGKINLARERLARQVWKELNEMTHVFQEDKSRGQEVSVLITHLEEVKKLMQQASDLNHRIDLHFNTMKKYAWWRNQFPGSLEKAFKNVQKECEKISKDLQKPIQMKEHARESKEEYSSSQKGDSTTTGGSGSTSISHSQSSPPASPVALSPGNSVSKHLLSPQPSEAVNPADSLSQSSQLSSVVIMHRTATVALTDKRPSTSQTSSVNSVEKALRSEGYPEVERGHDAGGYAASVDLGVLGKELSCPRDVFNEYIEKQNKLFLLSKRSSSKKDKDVSDFCIDPEENSGRIKNVLRS